jgi:hypothetical protein
MQDQPDNELSLLKALCFSLPAAVSYRLAGGASSLDPVSRVRIAVDN